MAGIRKKEKANGRPRYYASIIHEGREVHLGGYRTRELAKRALRKAEDEIGAGTFGRQEAVTFSELASTWLESVKHDVKPSAYSDYEIQVRVHLVPYFGERAIGEITPADVDKYRTAKASEKRPSGEPYSPRRVNKSLVTLGAIFKFAVANEYITASPTRATKKVKEVHREMDYLEPEEIARLLDACDDFLYPIVLTAVCTGLRQGELFALRWSDIDLDRSRISVSRSYHPSHGETSTKSARSRRKVIITPILRDELIAHRARTAGKPGDLVFRNRADGRVDYHNVTRRHFAAALERANLRHIRFHDLRHTFAALLIHNGVNIKVIQELMGHADIGTTLNTYGHLLDNAAEGVGEGLDNLIYPNGVRKPTGRLQVVK